MRRGIKKHVSKSIRNSVTRDGEIQCGYEEGSLPMLSPPPSFSVIMPVYNMAHRGLDRAIESVIGQTCQDWELVIVNDGSTDGSEKILEYYAARDPRIKLHHKPNGGIASSRNAGYWLARGEFIAHLDGDDEYLPDKLERQLIILSENPHAGTSFGKSLINGIPMFNWDYSGNIYDGWDAVREKCLTPCQSVVLRRSLLQTVRGNDVETREVARKAQDWDQWVRAFSVSESAILNEPTYVLYRHPDSLTAQSQGTIYGAYADQIIKQRAERIDKSRHAYYSRPCRLVILGFDAYARGGQQVVRSIIEHLPDEFEITLALEHMKGELLETYRNLCNVVSIKDAHSLIQSADIVHWHYYGWNPSFPMETLGSHLLVTEHSALCRYRGDALTTRVWLGERPDISRPLPLKYEPSRIEICNPVDLPETTSVQRMDTPLVLGLIPAQQYKGIDLWLDAAEETHARNPNVQFLIVGLRRDVDHNFEETVKRIDEMKQKGARIEWKEPQSRETVKTLCEQASVLLHLPRTEAVGMVILESQSVGTPAVVSAVGGTRQATYFGRTVPANNPVAAANAVLDMIGKQVPTDDVNRIRWRHDPRRVATSYAEIYRWMSIKSLLER